MESQVLGWIIIGALFILLALRVPVAFALAAVGFVGYIGLTGLEPALFMAGVVPYDKVAYYNFTVIPLFILMGHFANQAGIVKDVFGVAQKWLGVLPGGVVHATVAGAACFGAACGSGMASCAILGKICVPEMYRQGVNKELALGTVAAAGTIAAMIPPSNVMVIYGILTEKSISKLLIAGIVPGIMVSLIYMAMIYIRVKLNPGLVPQLGQRYTWKEKFVSIKNVWGIALIAFILMGGMYTGIFTPTEAGAIGAFSAFIMSLVMGRLSWSIISNILLETTRTVGMIFLIVVGAGIFSYLLTVTRLPTQIAQFLIGLQVNRYIVLIGIMALFVVMGALIDAISMLLIIIPIIFPAIVALGFNPIWFGVLIVFQVEIALITPPFAMNIFILKGVVPESTTGEIIRGLVPFILIDFVILAILIIFPELSLWLPSLMG